MPFRALLARPSDGSATPVLEVADLDDGDLMDGDVKVDVAFSTVNYKDGLAVTGRAPILRTLPLIPGIDLAGTVAASSHPGFAPGDHVVLNGYGIGETHHGGYAQRARVPGDWLVRLPEGIDARRAMAIGTAGYTAMLCVLALEDNGLAPAAGEVVVTGAAGGVGSVAVALLHRLGYRVVASTGRPAESGYLCSLGADEVIERSELSTPGRPIGRERWAGAVDSVGSHTLANVLASTRYGGTVAACGLAQGNDLPASVLPFILRAVTLAGVDSVQAPMAKRVRAWARLATDLDRSALDSMTTTIGLSDVVATGERILAGEVRGRTVVDVQA